MAIPKWWFDSFTILINPTCYQVLMLWDKSLYQSSMPLNKTIGMCRMHTTYFLNLVTMKRLDNRNIGKN